MRVRASAAYPLPPPVCTNAALAPPRPQPSPRLDLYLRARVAEASAILEIHPSHGSRIEYADNGLLIDPFGDPLCEGSPGMCSCTRGNGLEIHVLERGCAFLHHRPVPCHVGGAVPAAGTHAPHPERRVIKYVLTPIDMTKPPCHNRSHITERASREDAWPGQMDILDMRAVPHFRKHI